MRVLVRLYGYEPCVFTVNVVEYYDAANKIVHFSLSDGSIIEVWKISIENMEYITRRLLIDGYVDLSDYAAVYKLNEEEE